MCREQHLQPLTVRILLACFLIFSVIIGVMELHRRDVIVMEKDDGVPQAAFKYDSVEDLIEIEIYDYEG